MFYNKYNFDVTYSYFSQNLFKNSLFAIIFMNFIIYRFLFSSLIISKIKILTFFFSNKHITDINLHNFVSNKFTDIYSTFKYIF